MSQKALDESKIEICIQFKEAAQDITRDELVIRIQPSEAIYLKLNTNMSGLDVRAIPTETDLTHNKRFADTPILKHTRRLSSQRWEDIALISFVPTN